jgi:hypothetical protein
MLLVLLFHQAPSGPSTPKQWLSSTSTTRRDLLPLLPPTLLLLATPLPLLLPQLLLPQLLLSPTPLLLL